MTDLTVINRKDILGHLLAPEIWSPFATLLSVMMARAEETPLVILL